MTKKESERYTLTSAAKPHIAAGAKDWCRRRFSTNASNPPSIRAIRAATRVTPNSGERAFFRGRFQSSCASKCGVRYAACASALYSSSDCLGSSTQRV